jgi:peptidyl-prolyl cis-trans isomerase A (cyclophilin A)
MKLRYVDALRFLTISLLLAAGACVPNPVNELADSGVAANTSNDTDTNLEFFDKPTDIEGGNESTENNTEMKSGDTTEPDSFDKDPKTSDNTSTDQSDSGQGDQTDPDSKDSEDQSKGNTNAARVRFTTTMGAITLEMLPDDAPITVENFLQYVEDGFYDGTDGLEPTTFHRVIPGFVIQGGGITEDLVRKETRDAIVNESTNGLLNLRGTISMARMNKPDTATSQFFINLVDNAALDPTQFGAGYAVFAVVVEGMDVIDKIAMVETTTILPFSDVPKTPIVITSAEIIE